LIISVTTVAAIDAMIVSALLYFLLAKALGPRLSAHKGTGE
jgi:hypothetical protein